MPEDIDFIKLKNQIVDLRLLVIISMVVIFVVYKVAETLIGQLPAKIASLIISLAVIFAYATSSKIRKEIYNWIRQDPKKQVYSPNQKP